jgi:hypothetical protein
MSKTKSGLEKLQQFAVEDLGNFDVRHMARAWNQH